MKTHAPKIHTVYFRFYEELNDFLTADKRRKEFAHNFRGEPSVKDTIEAIGVPHTEIDLILINEVSVDFQFQLQGNERISVYPVFESMDIAPLVRLRPRPLRESKFIADVHLGTLARKLRLLGFDTLYQNNFDDPEIIDLALAEHRIILTRDKGILKQSRVTHGYWIRQQDPIKQTREVIRRFQLEE